MKKIIIITILLMTATTTFSQQTSPSPNLTKQDYLKKSMHQKTAAWILLGAGSLSAIVGSVRSNPNGAWGGDASNSNSAVFLVTGLAAIGASIPLLIASSRNKKKGMSLSFKNETGPQLQKSSFVYKTIPSLTLKISL